MRVLRLSILSVYFILVGCKTESNQKNYGYNIEINQQVLSDSSVVKYYQPFKKNLEESLMNTPISYSPETYKKNDGELNSALSNMFAAYDYPQSFVGLLSIPAGSAPSPFTVFAPVNSGFESLLDELDLNSLYDIDEQTLGAVLSYHVVVGINQFSMSLSDGMVFTTALDQSIPGGGNLTYNDGDEGPGVLTDNNERTSNMILLDVQADNGIIHAIDTVVLP